MHCLPEERVYDADDEQVPVVGVALEEVVVGAVDHGRADVLVHEEEEREREAEAHGAEDGAHAEGAEVDRLEDGARLGARVGVGERLDIHVGEEDGADEAEDDHGDREGVVGQELPPPLAQERRLGEVCK